MTMTHACTLSARCALAALLAGQLLIAAGIAPSAFASECAAGADAASDIPHAEAGEAERWVQLIAQRHAAVHTIHARITYDRIQDLLGAVERRYGRLVYDAGPPGRFAVHVDRLLVDDRLEQQDRWYVFDGRWLIERLNDRRQFLARQLVGPDTDPADQDPLALGRGPFVVPIGPNAQHMLERFDVSVIHGHEDDNDADTDEADTDAAAGNAETHDLLRLRLVPRDHDRTDFERIDIWYDRDTLLPQRVRSVDQSQNISDIFLRDAQLDAPVDSAIFDTTPPTERGWEIEITPWES
jgi:hypothetical protein